MIARRDPWRVSPWWLGWFAPWGFVLDALTAARIVRFLTKDHFPPVFNLRRRLVEAGNGNMWAQIWTCPWCQGPWIAGLVVGLHFLVVSVGGEVGATVWAALTAVGAMAYVVGFLAEREG